MSILIFDYLLLELLLAISIIPIYFGNSNMLVWYFFNIILLLVGLLILKQDSDILAGFLWVLDFGLSLVFFLFILFLMNFLQHKTQFLLNFKQIYYNVFIVIILSILYIFNMTTTNTTHSIIVWPFYLSYYDYYFFNNLTYCSDLNLLKEVFYVYSIYEFFMINYVVLYVIFTIIILFFLIKEISIYLNIINIFMKKSLMLTNFFSFFKIQKYNKQFYTSTGVRVWSKFNLT